MKTKNIEYKMKHLLFGFADCKAGALLLTRRSGTLRRAQDYNVVTKYMDFGDWSGINFYIDFFGNLIPELLSKHRLDYMKEKSKNNDK